MAGGGQTHGDKRETGGRIGGENTSLLGGGLGLVFCFFPAGSSRNPRKAKDWPDLPIPPLAWALLPPPGTHPTLRHTLGVSGPSPQSSIAHSNSPRAPPPTVKPSTVFPPRLSQSMPRPVPPHHSRTGAQSFLPETFRKEAPKSPSLAGEDFLG